MTRQVSFSTPNGTAILELKANGGVALRRLDANGRPGTSMIGNDTAFLIVDLLDRVEALEAKLAGNPEPIASTEAATLAEPEAELTLANYVNMNTATKTDLESLKGIGRATAKAIVDNRPYADLDDLKAKLGVSDAVIDSIKDLAKF